MRLFDRFRRPPAADPYERAADRYEEARRSRSLGDPIPPAPPGLDLHLPMRPSSRVVLGLLVVVVIVGVARSSQRSHAPALKTDCAHPKLVLSRTSAQRNEVIRWSATGPAGQPVVLAVDVARMERGTSGTYQPVPRAGTSRADIERASGQFTLTGCQRDGAFPVVVPPGRHTVTMFQLTGATATALASASFTVPA